MANPRGGPGRKKKYLTEEARAAAARADKRRWAQKQRESAKANAAGKDSSPPGILKVSDWSALSAFMQGVH